MNEAQFAHRVRHELNEGLALSEAQAARLRAARERALSAYRPEPLSSVTPPYPPAI